MAIKDTTIMTSKIPLPEKAASKNQELLLLLEHCLPKPNRKRWHKSPADIEALLETGGFNFPKRFVSNALSSNKYNERGWGLNRYQGKNWYCFDKGSREVDTPMEQGVVDKILTEDQRASNKRLPPNHLHSYELTYLNEYLKPIVSEDNAQNNGDNAQNINPNNDSQSGSAGAQSHPTSTRGNQPSAPANNSDSHNVSCKTACNGAVTFGPSRKSPTPDTSPAADAGTTQPQAAASKSKNGPKTPLPIRVKSGERIGKTIHDIGKYEEVVRMAEEHAYKCTGKCCKLKLTDRYKIGFQVFETYSCGFCGFERTIHGWIDDDNAKKKPGGQVNKNDEGIVHAAHGSAVHAKQLAEFCDQMGCVRPSTSALMKAYERRKAAVRDIGEEQLRINRVEHNRLMLETFGNRFVVEHTDSDGIVHLFISSMISGDGAGDKRCYNHNVTGKGHCTVLYSLITGKPLAVRCDQLSYERCERTMTLLVSKGKKPEDITEDDLKHQGKCSRNTKWSPAVAEENAMEELGKYLLIDPSTGKFRPDNEAVLARLVCTDGDTKGCNRFIKTQAELVPSFAGEAVYMPDIGHFVKAISGGMHALIANCKDLSGKSLLDGARIKTITADISRALRDYGKQLRSEPPDSSGPEVDDRIKKYRNYAMKRIKAIIPHHCGNHEDCSYDDCNMVRLERHFIAKYRVEFEGTANEKVSDEDIIRMHKQDILREYAKLARFHGEVMSMGKKGQEKVANEIFKRLDETNINRVAMSLSSNGCENFFSMLVKFSHGKRLYFGQTDSWEVLQLLVVGLKSDDRIEDRIRAHAGILSSYVRDIGTAKLIEKKEYDRKYKATETFKKRRKLKQITKMKDVVKNKTAPAAHRSNKLSPKSTCKSQAPKTKKAGTKRKKCSNCGLLHSGECQDPKFAGPKRSTKEQKRLKELEEKLEETWGILCSD